MLNINFVPEDYIKSNESHRTNFLYLILFAILMTALGGTFLTIKVRQRELVAKEASVNEKMVKAQESIKQLEQLQTKRKDMMKTALTTAELIEPVPRSVLLACLTNNLPPGVSLLELNVVQKEPLNKRVNMRTANKYNKAKTNITEASEDKVGMSKEKLLETYIDIEGIATSDFEVAAYIERLSDSKLMDDVALVESKEYKKGVVRRDQQDVLEPTLRQFKLTAMLTKGVHLSKDDINSIRKTYEEGTYRF
jgi:Tfp pilus assembly protein PilN